MFLIKWRRRMETDRFRRVFSAVVGLSRYPSRERAEQQMQRFRKVFPFNSYFIEQAS